MADSDTAGISIRQVEAAMRRWMETGETGPLEHVLGSGARRGGEALDGLFVRFGKDDPEPRTMGDTLRTAVATARDEEKWAEAAPVFCDEMVSQPDYDVPYIWIADFLERSGETRIAIALLEYAALACRRSYYVLGQAAEFSLFIGEVRNAVHLLAQSIEAISGQPDTGPGRERVFLIMAELLEVYDDQRGWSWARGQARLTELEDDFVQRVRDAAVQVTSRERAVILREVPMISDHIQRLFRGGRAQRIGTRGDRRERRMLVRAWAERAAHKHDANPPLPEPYETIAEQVAELAAVDHRLYGGMTPEQRKRWHDKSYLDRLRSSGEPPEECLRAIVELRAIGARLDADGGYELMVSVAERADVLGGTTILGHIEVCWNWIGRWMS